ncbi:fluoride efflux transporter CrcB [Porticoccus sp. W117]|uniref:fluoride efflux transporter CrcB n=1 Tax=Porticoccus sp. W117 TaxID=3054777 RepID=UPI0025915F20|nr:fluoride efflux transporter CrcB [Porticoccus sp. W117]MDM3871951.1 fluoride efflux transporter CrcB [Porticoccus sp. W117]
MQWLAVALGGALGAVCRFGVNTLVFPLLGGRFPLGTLLVNLSGSFLMGILYVLVVDKGVLPGEWRNLLMVGFLGAFTTFSAFSLDALALWQNGHPALSLGYIVTSVVGCLLATLSAIWLARLF